MLTRFGNRRSFVLLVGLAFGMTAALSAQVAPRPAGPAGPVVVSPEVMPDHRVIFRVLAPKATEVTLRGDWMEGAAVEKLAKADDGIWSVTVGPLVPDFYSYSFTVDGVKTLDPRNAAVKQGVSSVDSMVFVSGPQADFQDNLPVPHGQIRQVWYQSSTLGIQRRMHVYTPLGYDSTTTRYPVLYLLHGGGDEDSGWSTIGRAGFILDNLIALKKARPMLVVMPNGSLPMPANLPRVAPGTTPSPEVAAALAAARARFVPELMKEVIPTVEKNFRVVADRDHRAIAGLSMGGGHTLQVITAQADQFAYVGVWSAGIGQDPAEWEKRNEAFLANSNVNNWIKRLSISVGDKDFALNGSKALHEVLDKRGIKNRLHISGGGHTWINWRQYLRDFASELFPTS